MMVAISVPHSWLVSLKATQSYVKWHHNVDYKPYLQVEHTFRNVCYVWVYSLYNDFLQIDRVIYLRLVGNSKKEF
jgi:hypothetical protein